MYFTQEPIRVDKCSLKDKKGSRSSHPEKLYKMQRKEESKIEEVRTNECNKVLVCTCLVPYSNFHKNKVEWMGCSCIEKTQT